jgi:hypothetical protein
MLKWIFKIIMDTQPWFGVYYSINIWVKIIYFNIFNILASQNGHTEIEQILKSAGAKWSERSELIKY